MKKNTQQWIAECKTTLTEERRHNVTRSKEDSDEQEKREKESIEKELKEATAAKLPEHRMQQMDERVEYKVLRTVPEPFATFI